MCKIENYMHRVDWRIRFCNNEKTNYCVRTDIAYVILYRVI